MNQDHSITVGFSWDPPPQPTQVLLTGAHHTDRTHWDRETLWEEGQRHNYYTGNYYDLIYGSWMKQDYTEVDVFPIWDRRKCPLEPLESAP